MTCLCSGVVLLWAGGPGPPQYLAQTIVKVGFGPPQYLRQKGPRMILEAWAPQYQKHDYTPVMTYVRRALRLTYKIHG